MMVASQPGGPQKYWPCGSSHRTFWGAASQNDAKYVKIEEKKMVIKKTMLAWSDSQVECRKENRTVARCGESSGVLTLIKQSGLCQTSQDPGGFRILLQIYPQDLPPRLVTFDAMIVNQANYFISNKIIIRQGKSSTFDKELGITIYPQSFGKTLIASEVDIPRTTRVLKHHRWRA